MKRVHFIGIGGYSMSGLALWLHHLGYTVTGSDMSSSSRTERLLLHGIPVTFGHDVEHLAGVDEVIYSTDVAAENVERAAAVKAGLIVRHRSDLLAEIMAAKRAITVSGTHGKTTTTTMIGTALARAGLDPSVLVGGEVESFGGNVRVGQSPWIVVEADESDGSFLRYRPEIAVATNIEPEHLEHFNESFQVLTEAFASYLGTVPKHGAAIVGYDDPVLAALIDTLNVPSLTYGFSPGARVRGVIERQDRAATIFHVFDDTLHLGSIQLEVPGLHNVKNALAVIAVAQHLNVDRTAVFRALAEFRNANRRFQVLVTSPVLVVDDYAHHPTEIRATLEACRQVTPGRVIALFQPQRYVRTMRLWDEFLGAFDACDMLIMTEIYAPPGESPIGGISGQALAEAIERRQSVTVHYVPDMFQAIDLVLPILVPGDTFLTMGAGPVHKVGERMSQLLA